MASPFQVHFSTLNPWSITIFSQSDAKGELHVQVQLLLPDLGFSLVSLLRWKVFSLAM
jgi:hypothetical protein